MFNIRFLLESHFFKQKHLLNTKALEPRQPAPAGSARVV